MIFSPLTRYRESGSETGFRRSGAPDGGACPAVRSDAHIYDESGSTGTGKCRLLVVYQLSGKSLRGNQFANTQFIHPE